jgi:hypothetical protein
MVDDLKRRKQKEKERNQIRKKEGYFKEWERKNKEIRGARWLNREEAELILKFLPIKEETRDLINKLKKMLRQ